MRVFKLVNHAHMDDLGKATVQKMERFGERDQLLMSGRLRVVNLVYLGFVVVKQFSEVLRKQSAIEH